MHEKIWVAAQTMKIRTFTCMIVPKSRFKTNSHYSNSISSNIQVGHKQLQHPTHRGSKVDVGLWAKFGYIPQKVHPLGLAKGKAEKLCAEVKAIIKKIQPPRPNITREE